MITNPERSILADRELLDRIEKLAEAAEHPLVKRAYEADIRYLRRLVNTYERVFFNLHGI